MLARLITICHLLLAGLGWAGCADGLASLGRQGSALWTHLHRATVLVVCTHGCKGLRAQGFQLHVRASSVCTTSLHGRCDIQVHCVPHPPCHPLPNPCRFALASLLGRSSSAPTLLPLLGQKQLLRDV